jgi:quercetin dioxygenase-like cupin family protein
MALPHAVSGHPLDVGPLGERLPSQKTAALFKSTDLEVIRLVLPAGKSLPPHKVPGDITVQCIEGQLCVTVDGTLRELLPGELVFLAGGVVHAVTALTDASALVTIALKPLGPPLGA